MKIFRVCVFRVVDIFSGCSGFGWEWLIWEFSFKSAVGRLVLVGVSVDVDD